MYNSMESTTLLSVLTFVGQWFLIAVAVCAAHYVMRKRIDAEQREEELDERNN